MLRPSLADRQVGSQRLNRATLALSVSEGDCTSCRAVPATDTTAAEFSSDILGNRFDVACDIGRRRLLFAQGVRNVLDGETDGVGGVSDFSHRRTCLACREDDLADNLAARLHTADRSGRTFLD